MINYLKMQKAMTIMLALLLALAVPVAAYANDGKKHFKEGMKYAENRQWDKAAERFALAVAEKPSNIEYQLHFHRSLVNAGIMLVERGDSLAAQKDYKAAFNAYRQAYAFDRANELSLVKMRRMLELQGLPTDDLPSGEDPAGPKYRKASSKTVETSYNGTGYVGPAGTQLSGISPRRFPKTNIIARSDNLMSFITQLAQDMGLNVMFDQQAERQISNQKLNIDLRDVTRPKALEMILQTHNLMYAQLDTRTIIIASDNAQSRMRYEPLAVRTFYIKNGDINDIRQAITSVLMSKQVVPIKQLNALVVRDTKTNLDLIETLINSMDKSKAEVLIDINIYEVSRNNILQIGNQFNVAGDGGQSNALNLSGFAGLGQGGSLGALGSAHRFVTDGSLGFFLGLPPSLISFFQDKGKSKLLASTQVHILDREQHTINIGQRVPIQTAFIPTFSNTVNTGRNNNNNNPNQNPTQNPNNFNQGVNFGFSGGGFPQFQYENVGLNIDMQPEIYENEVQVKMRIESSSLDRSTGNFTPSFNQRTMTSVARIKDGQPTLIAGVSQTEEAKQIRGVPVIGLIPILGRFFATPTTTDRQSDVVITVTPHILRRADIREEDHLAYNSGTRADPSTQLTLEQIIYLAEQGDAQNNQVASTHEPPKSFAPAAPDGRSAPRPDTGAARTSSPGVVVLPGQEPAGRDLRTRFQPAVERRTVDTPGAPPRRDPDEEEDDKEEEAEDARNGQTRPIEVSVRSASSVAVKNQDVYAAVIVNGTAEVSSTTISLSYDSNILEVKNVRDGGLLRVGGADPDLQFTTEEGTLNVQLNRPPGSNGVAARGQLLLIVFKVKGQGVSPLTLNEGQTLFYSPTGEAVPVKLQSSQVEVR